MFFCLNFTTTVLICSTILDLRDVFTSDLNPGTMSGGGGGGGVLQFDILTSLFKSNEILVWVAHSGIVLSSDQIRNAANKWQITKSGGELF